MYLRLPGLTVYSGETTGTKFVKEIKAPRELVIDTGECLWCFAVKTNKRSGWSAWRAWGLCLVLTWVASGARATGDFQ